MIMIDDMKVRAARKTTQDVQMKDFISFNFQWRPLENFDILKIKFKKLYKIQLSQVS